MAKKNQGGGKQQARGLLSDPRRNIAEGAPRDRGPNARVRLGKERFGTRSKYPGVSKDQRAILNQMEAGDLALGDMGQAMLPGVQRNFEQPWDDSGLPQSPWAQFDDVKGMQNHYYDEVYGNYSRQAEPQYQKQITDFETSMLQRGIPIGSELYNEQKKQLLDTQEGERQSMRTQALSGAGQYAGQWQDMGRSNYFDARGVQTEDRNRPLAEYNALMGSQSGMAPAALQQSYDRQNAKWGMANMPSGGGGGGGGSGYLWQQYGFSSPQEYDQYKLNQSMAGKEAEYALAAKYAPKQPNPYAGAAGGILGGLAQGVGAGVGKGIAGWF